MKSILGQRINPLNKYYYSDLETLIRDLSNQEKIQFLGKNNKLVPRLPYYTLVNHIGELSDIQSYFGNLYTACNHQSKIIITYYNYLWEPILKLIELLGLKRKVPEQNWLGLKDIQNILFLSNFKVVKQGQRMLFPIYIPFISNFINRYLSLFPLFNKLCLTFYLVARPIPIPQKSKKYSVSVVVAARNEAGNIENLIKDLPNMGKEMEIVFIEGHSKDNTWETILQLQKKYKYKKIKALRQKGIGKADAIHLGIAKSKGDIIIILDADLTVKAQEMPKFYNAIAQGKGEFINGSRLIYPLEKDSMRFLNKIGNALFSTLFSWTLNQRFTDTLCGTKAFFRKDYQKIMSLRNVFGEFDPFGDFELIFGATKLNLQVIEIPVRYKPRVYGSTNIHRFSHGFLLFKMWLIALKRFRIT